MPLHGVNDLCQLGIVNGGSVQTGNEMLYRKRNGQHTRTGAIRLEICCKRINLFLKICQWGSYTSKTAAMKQDDMVN